VGFFSTFFYLQVGFTNGLGATATSIQTAVVLRSGTFSRIRTIKLKFLANLQSDNRKPKSKTELHCCCLNLAVKTFFLVHVASQI